MDAEWLAKQFEDNRGHLRAVAFRMLGSNNEAEDAVQEAWLRLSRADSTGVQNLGGWLTTVVGRVCLDMLRSRKSRREELLNEQVAEPVVGREDQADPEHQAVLADSVGMALLVVRDAVCKARRRLERWTCRVSARSSRRSWLPLARATCRACCRCWTQMLSYAPMRPWFAARARRRCPKCSVRPRSRQRSPGGRAARSSRCSMASLAPCGWPAAARALRSASRSSATRSSPSTCSAIVTVSISSRWFCSTTDECRQHGSPAAPGRDAERGPGWREIRPCSCPS